MTMAKEILRGALVTAPFLVAYLGAWAMIPPA